MNLLNLIQRTAKPKPWSEGDNIPWNDPGFSQRMLDEHLTQEHDAASRRFEKIDQHVDWIHNQILEGKPGKILDLGCGPGLYISRLARLGYICVGIDYSPASIAFAQETAREEDLSCTYIQADLRQADYEVGFDAVMLIFGEFNVFEPRDASLILKKAYQALEPDGWLILEPHTNEAIEKIGKQSPSWYSSPQGLFSERPHLVLQENFWDEETKTATIRYFVLDANRTDVVRFAQSFQAYQQSDYQNILADCGFAEINFYPALTGTLDPTQECLQAIVARKPGS
jgi:SAM-dependent methyltransferase